MSQYTLIEDKYAIVDVTNKVTNVIHWDGSEWYPQLGSIVVQIYNDESVSIGDTYFPLQSLPPLRFAYLSEHGEENFRNLEVKPLNRVAYGGVDNGNLYVGGSIFLGGNTASGNSYSLNFQDGTIQSTAAIVTSINGASGAVGFTAGSNITITQSGNTFTISSTGSGGATGATGAVGATGATGTNGTNGATGATGAIPTNYVISIDGVTGAITNVARTNQGNTFSVRQVMNAGITTANLYVTSGATFASTATFSASGSAIQLTSATSQISALNSAGFLSIFATGSGFGIPGIPAITLQDSDTDIGGSPNISIVPASLANGTITLGSVYTTTTIKGTVAGATFTGRQTFTGGITAANLQVTSGATFTSRASFSGGLTANNIFASSGVTFNSTSAYTGLATFSNGINGVTASFTGSVSSNAGYQITSGAINAQTGTTYSLLTTDNGKIITWNNNTSGVTLTVPSGLPIGFNTTVIQTGTGSVGITGSGVTMNSFEGKLRIVGQHGAVSIISYASNVFNVAGGLTG